MNKSALIKNSILFLLIAISTMQTSCTDSGQNPNDKREMVLWYNKPANRTWLDGLFIGNGYMGANVFGRIQNERIALNESTFWSGRPHDYNDPDAYKYFDKIKALVFADKFQEAEKLINEHFYGIPTGQQTYEPVGDLIVNFKSSGDSVKNYYRELDMETGVVKISYTQGSVKMTREVFMSYPDRVLVMRVSANKSGRISLEAKLRSPYLDNTSAQDGKLVMTGTWRYLPKTIAPLIAKVDGPGLRFQTSLVAIPVKGKMQSTDSSLVITNANSVTFKLTIATSFVNYKDISGDPSATCDKIMNGVKDKDFNTLKEAHLKDFIGLMSRVHLKIGDPLMNQKPTNERIASLKKGQPDVDLLGKVFQFGRYILVSSSRKGSEPANLQARWGESVLPNWGSKYTININTEMNYWPAEITNLSECHQPLFDLISDLAEAGAKTAKTYYNAGGWVAHHNTDLWRGTAPVDAARYGMWPVGGTWLCLHIWEHYQFTGDVDFLKKYYPIMKGAAQFLMDIMTIEPRHKWLVIPFSMSPEQGFYVNDKAPETFVCSTTTMNLGMIRDLFPHVIETEKILNVDQDFGNKLAEALTKIPPYQIGKDGTLQTWIEDWKKGRENHNMSANFGFYPGNSITLRGNPELAAAIRKWLEPRKIDPGWWNGIWDICDWARLEDGAMAEKVMGDFFRTSSSRGGLGNNLQNAAALQSDSNFGFTAAVAECLLQSHSGEISLLPALPPGWKDGSVSGLKARNGFELSMEWKEGKLIKAEIKSLLGNPCVVRVNGKTTNYSPAKGETIVIAGV
jgi:alpha-L-fucosidase 2